MVAVVMPSEDIEIFCKIIKKDYKADRYVEKSSNDKENPLFHIAYGDKNTADFILTNLNTTNSMVFVFVFIRCVKQLWMKLI